MIDITNISSFSLHINGDLGTIEEIENGDVPRKECDDIIS